MDSVMNERMKSGYANKHFVPKGAYDKTGERIGFWKDYEVKDDGAYQEVNESPMKFMGKYLLYGEGNYENGKRVGDWKIYVIEDGSNKKVFSEKLSYVDGKPQGPFEYYYPGGEKAQEGVYQDGKMNGVVTILYTGGEVFGKQMYANGLKEGEQNYFYRSGKLNFIIEYKNGKEEGKYERWYENGNLKETVTNVAGNTDGVYRYYYPDGKLWTEKVYSNGRLMNVVSIYDKNGNELEKGDLKDGNGVLNYYDEDGRIYQRVTYKDGKEIKTETVRSATFK